VDDNTRLEGIHAKFSLLLPFIQAPLAVVLLEWGQKMGFQGGYDFVYLSAPTLIYEGLNGPHPGCVSGHQETTMPDQPASTRNPSLARGKICALLDPR
jgi:hypothetical protein